MPGLFRYIKRSASHMAYHSALYDWSLRADVPERLIVRPVDPWEGCVEGGSVICSGGLPQRYHGKRLHGFEWLRDLRRFGREAGHGDKARGQARVMIESWVKRYGRWCHGAWDADVMGQRLSMWISQYEFYAQYSSGVSAEDDEFQDMLFESMIKQACHLSRIVGQGSSLATHMQGAAAFDAVKGLLYAGLAFEGREAFVEQALSCLRREIGVQILGDGAHKSRCPSQLMSVLRSMLDIRSALQAGGYPVPEILHGAIERAGVALQFFRYNDHKLALFNGSVEGDAKAIDAVLSQAGVRGKGVSRLAQAGFEKLSLGRTMIMFDCGKSPCAPFDRKAHAAPLSFEMAYGRERLFVNCGTREGDDELSIGWRDALRATAAHNAAVLGERNACEIVAGAGFSRKVQKCLSARDEVKGAVLVEGSHDGYEALNGCVQKRRIYVADDGHDVRGEDLFTLNGALDKPIDVAIRFHLHPRVMVSLIRDGGEALLRMPGGAGWRFHQGGGCIALEDSVYLGQGHEVRKTKQLVIYGQITDKMNKFNWAVQREG